MARNKGLIAGLIKGNHNPSVRPYFWGGTLTIQDIYIMGNNKFPFGSLTASSVSSFHRRFELSLKG